MNHLRSPSQEQGKHQSTFQNGPDSEARQENRLGNQQDKLTKPHGVQDLPREEEKKDPNQVDFDSPEDPQNPLNQSKLKKWVVVVTVASAALCV
jgi:hypothetical protein